MIHRDDLKWRIGKIAFCPFRHCLKIGPQKLKLINHNLAALLQDTKMLIAIQRRCPTICNIYKAVKNNQVSFATAKQRENTIPREETSPVNNFVLSDRQENSAPIKWTQDATASLRKKSPRRSSPGSLGTAPPQWWRTSFPWGPSGQGSACGILSNPPF